MSVARFVDFKWTERGGSFCGREVVGKGVNFYIPLFGAIKSTG